MSTLKQLIYNVRNPKKGGKGDRAQGYTDRQIAFWIKQGRNFLLYAAIEKKQEVHVNYEFDFGCLKLTSVDQADCAKFKWGNTVKKLVLPPILDLTDNMGITFFGLIDKQTRIYLPSQNWGELDDHMPYKKKHFFRASKIGNTVYVYPLLTEGDELNNAIAVERLLKLCVVNVRGVPEDPTLATTCESEDATPCCFDEDNDPYPVPAHLEGALFTWIDDNYLMKQVNLPEDTKNDEKRQSVA